MWIWALTGVRVCHTEYIKDSSYPALPLISEGPCSEQRSTQHKVIKFNSNNKTDNLHGKVYDRRENRQRYTRRGKGFF